MGNNNNYLEFINRSAQPALREAFVSDCEEGYRNKLNLVSQRVNESEGHEIILLAGPSSSGKTTTANLLSDALRTFGRKVFTISLDDYYRNASEAELDEEGNPDYETVHALDTPLLCANLRALIETGETEKPLFDFLVGKRKAERERIKMGIGDVVVVEGLHALNPLITAQLPQERVLKIYVNLNSRIYNEDGKIVLNKRNIRFVRRMVRDYKFRNSAVENTFTLWEKVTEGEEKYLYPFKDTADVKINSLHLYEPCVFAQEAIALLSEVKNGTKYYGDAQSLIYALKQFVPVSKEMVPSKSLLREFLGE